MSDDLYATWERRDARYAGRRNELSETMIEGVRDWRLNEANELPPAEQAKARSEASTWEPPTRMR